MAMRPVLPNTNSSAGCSCWLNGSAGDGGSAMMAQLMQVAKIIAPQPAQMARRARA